MSHNRLGDSASPYLRQHADNPVHWWPWSAEAFAEANRRDVPVHLSIGYAACHWCHVMAHESFSDSDVAALMNERFVNIKVDREERPDVDQIYMQALHGLGQPGGWPLTMFLTPDGEPFWGGTYFPPRPQWGRPSFREVLESLSQAWARRDPAIATNARALVDHLGRAPQSGYEMPSASLLDQAATLLLDHWDVEVGGFKGAPKFPQGPVLDVLWRAHLRAGDEAFERAVLTTLTSLCQGGIYDHLAGGFARYSTDADWKVPHFEKMLYDNAQILSGLTLGWARIRDPLYRARIVETADWLITDMRVEEGAFAASFDADTEGEEGKTYVWRRDEILQVLGDRDGEDVCRVYDVRAGGNWEGTNVLNRLSPASRAWLGDAEEGRLRALCDRLLDARGQRPQPARDDKVLADWNGMAISALVEAGVALGEPRWVSAAEEAYHAITSRMGDGDRLFHSRFEGRNTAPGLATDYAQMIRAALRLFAANGNPERLADARMWFEAVERHHVDPATGGVYLTADDAEALVVRPRSNRDEATPAAAGILLADAVALFQLTAEPRYRERAERLLAAEGGAMSRDVQTTASLQAGFDSLLRERLAVIAGEGAAAQALASAVLREADPALLRLDARAAAHLPADHPAAASRDSGAALYLCDATSCRAPVTDADAAARLLGETRAFRPQGLPFPG